MSSRHDVVLRRPLIYILSADGGRDQVEESIGRAGERAKANTRSPRSINPLSAK